MKKPLYISDKKNSNLIVEALISHGITNVVISPGSRNAPLIIDFTAHPQIKTYSIVDERSAGFFAMGIALKTQSPVAVCCSSGTALLNYYPAIAESFYQNIPIIILSADRPKNMIDKAHGQTIRQENVFANHIKKQISLSENDNNLNKKNIKNCLEFALKKRVPVHINIPFTEPLYNTKKTEFKPLENIFATTKDKIPIKKLQEFSNIWNNSQRKMILVGTNNNDGLSEVLNQINDDSVIVLAETNSNIFGKKLFKNIDKLIFSMENEDFKTLKPEILLTIGTNIVSKKIKNLLRQNKPKHHFHLGKYDLSPDTFDCLDESFKIEINDFFQNIKTKKTESNYYNIWNNLRIEKQKKHDIFLKKTQFCDLKSFEIIIDSLPKEADIQISNSSPVRYFQLFDLQNKTFCNRGTSGIDGSTSTAIGWATQSQNQTIFVTGDISFFYDSNALWNNYVPNNFRIILINNSGGEIFDFITDKKTDSLKEYFMTKHKLSAQYLANMYSFEFLLANNLSELSHNLKGFYKKSDRPKILEINTSDKKNSGILKNYFKFIK